MAKISLFLSFFLFVLIAMPISSSCSRMVLQKDPEVQERCPKVAPSCAAVLCAAPTNPCPQLLCIQGFVLYQPCCGCQICCPKQPKPCN
ncbi:hypothetical protein MKX03_005700 [Papaver bracteatum]|nr:hypothetical protein MKX03_005700 [Papaver bracteatum]